jgi:anti-sigma-K factor RskA
MSTQNGEAPERRDIEDLLPWHAAGTLGRRDAERVEAAVGADRELARRFDLVREELAETIHLNESLGAPSARAMQKLFAAIEEEGATSPRRSATFNLGTRISEFFASLSPRTLAWTATAAALAIILQAAVITSVVLKGSSAPNAYETASAEKPAQVAEQGSDVLIRFVPQASAADITKFLQAHEATIVAGPNGDFYRVRVAATRLPKDKLDALMKTLQAERHVVGFVVPTN